MGIAAVSVGLLTVLIGTLVLAEVKVTPALRVRVTGHIGLGLLTVLVLAGTVAAGSHVGAWVSLLGLSATAALGVSLWRHAGRRHTGRPAPPPVSPAMLVAHGMAALVTFILVLLTVAR